MVLLTVAAVLCTSAACHDRGLDHAQPSADALAREVLGAIARRDPQRLAELALNEPEFTQHVWPDLPAARPERNVPKDYVWGDLQQKSRQVLVRTLARHGGVTYALQSVRFAGATTDHGRYRVHREAVLVAHAATGGLHELRVLGSMIEWDGQWKVFSYVVDD